MQNQKEEPSLESFEEGVNLDELIR